jgi:hypothetical protein
MDKINIETIPHDQHRYETVGDYWIDENGVKQLRVSDMQNSDYEFLVALHELIEQKLCEKRGISEQAITEFDIVFEKTRQDGDDSEPGDNQFAPYRKEHFFATNIERLMAAELGVDWKAYDDTVMNL